MVSFGGERTMEVQGRCVRIYRKIVATATLHCRNPDNPLEDHLFQTDKVYVMQFKWIASVFPAVERVFALCPMHDRVIPILIRKPAGNTTPAAPAK